MSLAAAITPLVKAAQYRLKARWLVNVLAYAGAGALTSAAVGLALGGVGAALSSSLASEAALVAAIAIGLAVLVRELGLVALPLVQVRRATPGAWAQNLRGPLVPALWGFDLGLFFTTYFTFAGAWLLVAVVVLAGDPLFGAALLLAYWAGRVMSLALSPLLLPDASATSRLMQALVASRRRFQLVHAGAVVVMTAALVQMFVSSTPL